MMRTIDLCPYPIEGAYMNQSVPSTKVQPPSMPEVVGVDGRYAGCLRKFFGMKTAVNLAGVTGLAGIGAYAGPSFIKPVCFLKTGTATMVRGFLVRWDAIGSLSDQEVGLAWTVDNGATWAYTPIYGTGSNISSSVDMDCDAYNNFLLVVVSEKAGKTVYWDTAGSEMTVVDMGPGDFAAELAAPSYVSDAVDSNYYLAGKGTYQIAYRLFNSTRGIYSGISAPETVTLNYLKLSKATGYIYFNSGGAHSGLFADGDTVTVGGRTYEADSNSSVGAGNVAVSITGLTTIQQMCAALSDAVNGDASQTQVSARAGSATVTFEAKTRGVEGNLIALSVSEVGAGAADLQISSALLTGGGEELEGSPDESYKINVSLPDNAEVITDATYTDVAEMFDKIDVYRSVNLGGVLATMGAILYREQTLDLPASEGDWNSLVVSLGTMQDNALIMSDSYNPATDIITTPPASGVISRYQGRTYVASAVSTNGGLDIHHSSAAHESPEYFSTFNRRRGSAALGRIRRLIQAGDALFAMCQTGVTHVYKASVDTLQYVDLHRGRGIPGQGCCHAVGNSICMATEGGLVLLNGNDGNMGQISAADRVLLHSWAGILSSVTSGFDSVMNTSYFLQPLTREILCVFHGTQGVGMLQGANFAAAGDGLDVLSGHGWRSYFVTVKGKVVYPDNRMLGSGTMWDLSSSLTLNGTVTSSTTTSLSDTAATFGASMLGALVYFTSGVLRGQCRVITNVNGTTLSFSTVTVKPAVGDTYAISPVVWGVRFPRVRDNDARVVEGAWQRWVMFGMQTQFVGTTGFTGNPNNQVYAGIYRHGSSVKSTGEKAVGQFTMTENPAEAVANVQVDGVSVEPWLEQISSGTVFELTEAAAWIKMTQSQKVE